MNSLCINYFFILLSLTECRLFHLKNISSREVTSIAATSLGEQQAFSIVHCSLVCMNTKGCISTLYKEEICLLLKERLYGQNHRILEKEGAVMSQLDVSVLSESRNLISLESMEKRIFGRYSELQR